MVTIRQAIVSDAPIIQNLAETIWWPTYSSILKPDQIRYMLDHIYDLNTITKQITTGSQCYLVMEENSTPVGFASYSKRSEDPSVHKLHKLYCLPARQGQGNGRQLLAAVEKRTLEEGNKLLDLNVNKFNPARSFYEKMGFSVIYEEDIPIGPYWMNDFVMRKQLS